MGCAATTLGAGKVGCEMCWLTRGVCTTKTPERNGRWFTKMCYKYLVVGDLKKCRVRGWGELGAAPHLEYHTDGKPNSNVHPNMLTNHATVLIQSR